MRWLAAQTNSLRPRTVAEIKTTPPWGSTSPCLNAAMEISQLPPPMLIILILRLIEQRIWILWHTRPVIPRRPIWQEMALKAHYRSFKQPHKLKDQSIPTMMSKTMGWTILRWTHLHARKSSRVSLLRFHLSEQLRKSQQCCPREGLSQITQRPDSLRTTIFRWTQLQLEI
mgnify:CR=1 FL=1